MCMAGLILAVACSNVASLMAARTIARQRETAARLAIGAGRMALIRQLLVESTLLSLAGAVLGLGYRHLLQAGYCISCRRMA
jgi:ABC-type antimicrobial peptide transport system permease subunit